MDADRNRVLKALLADRVRLFSYIWAIVRDEHLAEDVFQDVSMLAMDSASSACSATSPSGTSPSTNLASRSSPPGGRHAP